MIQNENNLRLANVALMIHVHQTEAWAFSLKEHLTGEMKYRLNAGLNNLKKLCTLLGKESEDSDFLYERGHTIDRLLSLSKDDPKKYHEIIDLIQMHLNGDLTIINDGDIVRK